jgi:hypothetical protein
MTGQSSHEKLMHRHDSLSFSESIDDHSGDVIVSRLLNGQGCNSDVHENGGHSIALKNHPKHPPWVREALAH